MGRGVDTTGVDTTAARGSGVDMGMVVGMGASARSVESWRVAKGAARAGVVTTASSVGGVGPLVRQ